MCPETDGKTPSPVPSKTLVGPVRPVLSPFYSFSFGNVLMNLPVLCYPLIYATCRCSASFALVGCADDAGMHHQFWQCNLLQPPCWLQDGGWVLHWITSKCITRWWDRELCTLGISWWKILICMSCKLRDYTRLEHLIVHGGVFTRVHALDCVQRLEDLVRFWYSRLLGRYIALLQEAVELRRHILQSWNQQLQIGKIIFHLITESRWVNMSRSEWGSFLACVSHLHWYVS